MISKKNVQFLHSPSPFFLSVRMTPNWAGPPTSGRRNLSYQPPPPLSPLVFLQKIGMLQRKTECSLEPSFLQNQTPVCQEHLQQNQTPARNNVWTRVTLMLTIAVDIQFLWIPSPCNHPLPSEFLSFFN